MHDIYIFQYMKDYMFTGNRTVHMCYKHNLLIIKDLCQLKIGMLNAAFRN